MLLLIATFSLTLTSCGNDDKDEPGNPGSTSSDITSGSVSEGFSIQLTSDSWGPMFFWYDNKISVNVYTNSAYSYNKR